MLASKYTQGLEACIAQDYMLTEVMTSMYTRIPAENARKWAPSTPINWRVVCRSASEPR